MAYEHLRSLVQKAGKSQADLARVLNKTPAVVTNLFNGVRELKEPEVKRISTWLKLPVEEIMGMRRSGLVPIVGEVGAGGEVYPIDDLPLLPSTVDPADEDYVNCEWVEAPPGIFPAGIVAVRVKGNSMLPFMPPGTVVYYAERFDGGAPDHALSSLCVVQMRDERTMLKMVRKGQSHGKFDLVSYNMETITDVELAWCAPVVFIKPFLRAIP